jgi:hypothetical protein
LQNTSVKADGQPLGMLSAFTLLSCSAYSTLKMEARFSSETLVDFQRITWRYIPEDSILLKMFNFFHFHVGFGVLTAVVMNGSLFSYEYIV